MYWEPEDLDTLGLPDRAEMVCLDEQDAVLWALYWWGLLYHDEQERGAGFTLDIITHDEQDFLVSYKSPRGPRRREHREARGDDVSPARSFVDITSDEELAAFLSVYDYVDLGPGISDDEGFGLV